MISRIPSRPAGVAEPGLVTAAVLMLGRPRHAFHIAEMPAATHRLLDTPA